MIERLSTVNRLFLKMQSGHCIFYLYTNCHPEKRASRPVQPLPPRGKSAFVAEETGGAGSAIGTRFGCKERSHEASKDIMIFYLVHGHK